MVNYSDPIPDPRWLCWSCGDLDHLNDDGLCSECAPEPVAEFYEICMRAVAEERKVVRRVWRIG